LATLRSGIGRRRKRSRWIRKTVAASRYLNDRHWTQTGPYSVRFSFADFCAAQSNFEVCLQAIDLPEIADAKFGPPQSPRRGLGENTLRQANSLLACAGLSVVVCSR
jgi:hypothetical protein